MANLRVRFKFNPGRVGSPMDKLGEYASQTEKFLRSLANDLGIVVKKGEWLARNFKNGSVEYDGELQANIPEDVAIKGRAALEAISGSSPIEACNRGLIGYGTIAEFSRMSKIMDPDETFFMGVYENGEVALAEERWREISYSQVAEIRTLLAAPYVTYGSIQGTIYAWHKDAKEPFFTVRELSTTALVKCIYGELVYDKIHEATENRHAVVHVYGDAQWDRANNQIVELSVKELEIANTLSDSEFEKLFGSLPGFTGQLDTADYIEWIRGDNND